MSAFVDRTGLRYGRLVVQRRGRTEKRGGHYRTHWICRCDCGNEFEVMGQSLQSGGTASCGCYYGETRRVRAGVPTTHGRSYTDTYEIWSGMKRRCSNPNNKRYADYGGRGIKVCDRWLSFENFLADMGERPEGMTIERKDNNGNYEPSNCRWATQAEQNRNKRNNRFGILDGERLTLDQIAARTGASYSAVYYRHVVKPSVTNPS